MGGTGGSGQSLAFYSLQSFDPGNGGRTMRTLLNHADQSRMRQRSIRGAEDGASMKANRNPVRRADRDCVRRWIAVAVLVFAGWASSAMAPSAISQQPASVTIQGKVTNPGGSPPGNATIRLEHAGSSRGTTTTTADGSFTFRGLAAGDYTLVAEDSGRRSAPVTIHAQFETQTVVLVIGDSAHSASAMEFADNPNFTVAAVTD